MLVKCSNCVKEHSRTHTFPPSLLIVDILAIKICTDTRFPRNPVQNHKHNCNPSKWVCIYIYTLINFACTMLIGVCYCININLTSCLYWTQSFTSCSFSHMTAGWHQCKFRVISAGKAAATKVLIHLKDVTATYLQCCWLCLANDIVNLIYPAETGMLFRLQ